MNSNYVSIYPIKKELDLSDIYKRNEFLNSAYSIVLDVKLKSINVKLIQKYVCLYDNYNYYVYNHRWGELNYFNYNELECYLLEGGD